MIITVMKEDEHKYTAVVLEKERLIPITNPRIQHRGEYKQEVINKCRYDIIKTFGLVDVSVYELKQHAGGRPKIKIENLDEIMKKHLKGELTIPKASQILGISVSTFCRRKKEYTKGE